MPRHDFRARTAHLDLEGHVDDDERACNLTLPADGFTTAERQVP